MPHGHAQSPSQPDRVLLIRPSALGDVCRTVPVLVGLRRAFPQAHIDWLVQDAFAPAIAAHPALSRVVPFPRSALAKWMNVRTWRPISTFLRTLRMASYDLVLDCQGLARSGLFAAATSAPRRIGLTDAAELGWLGVNEHVHGLTGAHTVERMLALLRAAAPQSSEFSGADLRLYSSPADREHLTTLDLAPHRYILLAPTSRWPGKLWPDDRYAQLSRLLLDSPSLGIDRVVFAGSASEQSQCPTLESLARADPRIVSLIGRTTIGQLMAVVEGARLIIANDSAALHMAVGFNRPLIGLFGPTRVERVGPYGRSDDVIQHLTPNDRLNHKDAHSGRTLMARITVEEVLAQALARLRKFKAEVRSSSLVTAGSGPS